MEFLGQQQAALFNQNASLMENAIDFRTPFKGNKVTLNPAPSTLHPDPAP